MRAYKRGHNELRPICFTRHYTRHAEGSVLAEFGDTQVLCTASVEERVPSFLRGCNQGWITAEYGMLPRATNSRTSREATRGRQSGRTLEIQRLIGRSLRSVVELPALGERTLTLDCDVLQADGGTRTAAITGAWIALADALDLLLHSGVLARAPLTGQIASVAVGIVKGEVVLDLDYAEDSCADTDLNIVMDEKGRFIEIQGTAEGAPFDEKQLQIMTTLAQQGIRQLIDLQKNTRRASIT